MSLAPVFFRASRRRRRSRLAISETRFRPRARYTRVASVASPSSISAYMVLRSPVLGGCTLAIVPFVGVLNKLYGDWLGKNARRVQTALADGTSIAHESLGSIRAVIALGCEDREAAKYRAQMERLYDLNIKQLIATGVYFMAVSTFLINTCVQASLLLLGSMFVEQGKLTPEVLLAFMLYQVSASVINAQRISQATLVYLDESLPRKMLT